MPSNRLASAGSAAASARDSTPSPSAWNWRKALLAATRTGSSAWLRTVTTGSGAADVRADVGGGDPSGASIAATAAREDTTAPAAAAITLAACAAC